MHNIQLGDVVLISLKTSVMSGVVRARTNSLHHGARLEKFHVTSWDLDGAKGEVELVAEEMLVLDPSTTAEDVRAFVETITDVKRANQESDNLKLEIPF